MPEPEITSDVTALTVQLLGAYLSNNNVPSADLAGLIRATKEALTADSVPTSEATDEQTFTPAVSMRKSLASPDYIVSMIDGKAYKTLKRHLSANGLTPDEYRRRYNLPTSYPMVAPTYSAHRRDVARKLGLGNPKSASAATAQGAIVDVEAVQADAAVANVDPDVQKRQPNSAKSKNTTRRTKSKAATTEVAFTEAAPTEAGEAAEQSSMISENNVVEKGAGAAERSPKGARKAAKTSPKRSAAKPRRPAGAKAKPDSESAIDADGPSGNDAPVEPQRERRGKLGLFNVKREETALAPSDKAESEDSAPPVTMEKAGVAAATNSKKAKGASRPKRMARSPQPPEEGTSEANSGL